MRIAYTNGYVQEKPYVRRYSTSGGLPMAILLIVTMFFLLTSYTLSSSFADSSLTSLMGGQDVRGSAKYIQYFAFYGTFTSFSITALSFLGLCQTFITISATFVYFLSRKHWDTVHEIKQAKAGSQGSGGGMGMQGGGYGGMQRGGMNGGMGGSQGAGVSSGIDSIIDIFYSINIDVLRYADVPESKGAGGMGGGMGMQGGMGGQGQQTEEYNSCWDWLIRRGPTMLLILIFLNMGYKGTLQMIMASTIDAVTIYAEALPYDKMSEWAEYRASVETGYTFTLGMSGSEEGKIKQNIAKRMFAQMQNMYRLTATEDIKALGTNIEQVVAKIENEFIIPPQLYAQAGVSPGADPIKAVDKGAAGLIWESLSFKSEVTTTLASLGVNGGMYIKIDDLTTGVSTEAKTKAAERVVNLDKHYLVVVMTFKDAQNTSAFDPDKPFVSAIITSKDAATEAKDVELSKKSKKELVDSKN